MKRLLVFAVVAAFFTSAVVPAAALSRPDLFGHEQSASAANRHELVVLSAQSLTANQESSAPVARDAFGVEILKPAAPAVVYFEPITGLLSTWPCAGPVNDGFGPRDGGFHNGIDVMCGYGAPAYATAPGVVIEVEWGGSWGQYVKIDHGNGVATLCAHMIGDSPTVVPGQGVNAGDVIGYVGDTGNASAPHCHFEVWVHGTRVDPMPWLP